MSEIDQMGRSAFFKNVWNLKMYQRSEGGGGPTLIGTLSQISSIFYFDASPNKDNLMGFDTIESNLVLDIVPFAY